MHWWKRANSPSSSSSSPKSAAVYPFSPSKQRFALRDLNLFRSRRLSSSQPRLIRQRKLRHLSDLEIDGFALNPRYSSPPSASENSPPGSRSPSDRDWAPAVVPVPLPVPDSGALQRRDAGLSVHGSGCCPLPSPREKASSGRVECDGAESAIAEAVKERILSSSLSGSDLVYQPTSKGEEKIGSPLRSTLGNGMRRTPDANSREKVQSFRLNVPTKSVPSSGFCSPERSPRRLSTGDYFPSLYTTSPGTQFRSVPEPPSSDYTMVSGFSSRTSPEKFAGHSPDWSPLHSPNGKNLNFRSTSPSVPASPLHSKVSSEGSAAWIDGTISVHPLPLPPVASPAKSEASLMTSKWQKGKLLGKGTFGHVYEATNRETGALCAMKEVSLIPDDPKSAECVQSLEQEIKVLSQLKHPNIVQYYGSEIVEDRFYIYLEYVHPGSICKYVRDHCGAMTESVVRNFTRHILNGLAYLHSKKTIHRDIKGANLLVDALGVVKLADFGMAKHLSGQAAVLSMKGSPYWMAPEVMQAMMHKESGYDLAVDIWSLGCTIIEMITGKPPWSEFEGAAAMFKVLRNEFPPIPEMLSPEGKDFLRCCFRRNPADRPSATKLLEHRFLKNSHTNDIQGCIQTISRMNLTDVAQSPRDRANVVQTNKGRHSSISETTQAHHEHSESAADGPRHSPRSTLENLSSLSPPHTKQRHDSSPPNLLNGFHIGLNGNSRCF